MRKHADKRYRFYRDSLLVSDLQYVVGAAYGVAGAFLRRRPKYPSNAAPARIIVTEAGSGTAVMVNAPLPKSWVVVGFRTSISIESPPGAANGEGFDVNSFDVASAPKPVCLVPRR